MWPTRIVERARGLLVACVVLVSGCGTIDLDRALFEAGQQMRCRQWELEESRPAVDWPRADFDTYRAARAARLG